jgi:hypothetical protein
MPKEAMADISTLKMEVEVKGNFPTDGITLFLGRNNARPEIRFDVSVLDWETKHELDIKIRKVLKKHHIKFVFSNASNPKLNFYYGQKVMNK